MSEYHRCEADSATLSSDSLTSVTSISDVSLSDFLNDTIRNSTTTEQANVYNDWTPLADRYEYQRWESDTESLTSDSLTSVSDVRLGEFVNQSVQRSITTERDTKHNSQATNGCGNQRKSFVEETNFESNDVIGDAINQLRRNVHNNADGSVKEAMMDLRQIIEQEKAKHTKRKAILEQIEKQREMEKERDYEASFMLSRESLQSCINIRGLFFEPHKIDLNLAIKETEIIMISPPSSHVPEPDNDNKSVRTIARGLKHSIRWCFQCCTNQCTEDGMDENYVLDYDSD